MLMADPIKLYDLPPSWAVPAGAIEAWIVSAEPGDEIVYATGPSLPHGMASVYMVRELAEAGHVRLHMRRNRDTRALEYVAVRRIAESPVVPASPCEVDPRGIARRMMQLLTKAALTCRPCPTNAELAAALGLKNAEAARYEFNRLVRQGKITVADFGPRRRRVVTIVATGQQTRRASL